jgi:hypothetical protein
MFHSFFTEIVGRILTKKRKKKLHILFSKTRTNQNLKKVLDYWSFCFDTTMLNDVVAAAAAAIVIVVGV